MQGFTPGRVKVGGHIAIVCDEGYAVSGEGELECQKDGKYTAAGTCEPITCAPYQAPPHAKSNPDGVVKYKEQVNVTCDEGYAGGYVVVCGKDGYEGQGGECAPIMCPPYAPPPHASVTPTGDVQSGVKVNVTCDDGYAPSGPVEDVVCGPDGAYTGKAVDCVKVRRFIHA
jgi:hypothetical protein